MFEVNSLKGLKANSSSANGRVLHGVQNPFMMSYSAGSIFEKNKDLGFTFKNQAFVSKDRFESISDISERINREKPIVLNMGDSSTSGWNGELVHSGMPCLSEVLFTYKTYSDILSENLFGNVINAGIPSYSSHQGKKYLKQLIPKLAQYEIKPDFVTIYFGNNDSIYGVEDKSRFDDVKQSWRCEGVRVAQVDFASNLHEMVSEIRKIGAVPILIVPVVNYVHEPYIRSRKYSRESIALFESLSDASFKLRLQKAHDLWLKGDYRSACELDLALPRISENHRKVIFEIARKLCVVFIDVQDQISLSHPSDEDKYFIDYCHPNETVNKLIADRITDVVINGEQGVLFGQLAEDTYSDSCMNLANRSFLFALKILSGIISPFSSSANKSDNPSDKIYPHW